MISLAVYPSDELTKNCALESCFNAVSVSGFTVFVQMEGRFVLKSARFKKYPDSCGRGLSLTRFLFSRNEGCDVTPSVLLYVRWVTLNVILKWKDSALQATVTKKWSILVCER